jgi:hypothetical protein
MMRSRTRMLHPQQLENMHSHKHRPRKASNDYQYPTPVRHSPMRDDKPPMSADGRRYDAVPVGVRVSVSQWPGVEGRVGRGDLDRGILRAWEGGAVGYGLEVAIRVRG